MSLTYDSLCYAMLSHFSRVRLCATPQTAAHQAPPSLGFSRQEHWSGLPFPSPMHESESEREVAQSCPTLSDPMDCSLTGSSAHGIFQARVLEWDAYKLWVSSYIKNPTWDLILLLISLQCPVAIYFSFSLRLSYILDKTGLSSTH